MDGPRDTLVIGILVPSSADAGESALIREALRLARDGADIVDLDTTHGGPFAATDEDALALLVRALHEAGVPVSVTTTQASVARIAADRGARWIIDPSGTTADPEMVRVARRPSFVGWAIGPWSARDEPGAASAADRYAYGLVRNLAALLAAGVRSERIVLNASAGLSATAADRWLMLGDLARVQALGYPVLVDAPDEVLASMSSDESPAHLGDAAVGLALLAAGSHAWAIRTREVERVTRTIDRLRQPRRSA